MGAARGRTFAEEHSATHEAKEEPHRMIVTLNGRKERAQRPKADPRARARALEEEKEGEDKEEHTEEEARAPPERQE